MKLLKKELIVDRLKIGDKLINHYFVALEIVDITDSTENEITVKVRSIGRDIPKKLIFPKTQTMNIRLIGFREYIPLCGKN